MRKCYLFLFVLFSFFFPAVSNTVAASPATEKNIGTVIVTGEGSAHIPNDYVIIAFSVIREDESAVQAQRACLTTVETVLGMLKKNFGIVDEYIQTEQFQLYQQRADRIAGAAEQTRIQETQDFVFPVIYYRATNNMSLMLYDINLLSEILDSLTENGVSEIQSITSGSDHEEEYAGYALERAFLHARKQAEKIAVESGRTLGPVVEIEIFQGGRISPMMSTRLEAQYAPLPPDRKVEARIRVKFRLQ